MSGTDRYPKLSMVDRLLKEPAVRASLRAHAPELARGLVRRHPGARIGSGVRLEGPGEYRLSQTSCIRDGARLFVGPGAVLSLASGAAIGARCVVNVEHSVHIGVGTQVSWQCQILDTDFHAIDDGSPAHPRCAPVSIGDGVLIGTGAIILKGVTIGDGAVIGAGSVVSADVGPHRLVAGNPARDIRYVRSWK